MLRPCSIQKPYQKNIGSVKITLCKIKESVCWIWACKVFVKDIFECKRESI